MSRRGVPAFGIVASTALASIAMVINYLGSSGATVFTTLVLMTGITAAIPYAFSALAQIKWRWSTTGTLETPRFVARHGRRRRVARVLGPVHLVLAQHRRHGFWYWAPFFMAGGALLLGIPVYSRSGER